MAGLILSAHRTIQPQSSPHRFVWWTGEVCAIRLDYELLLFPMCSGMGVDYAWFGLVYTFVISLSLTIVLCVLSLTSYPGLHPDFISQPWRKAGARPGISYHGCEIKSGWRPGYEVIS